MPAIASTSTRAMKPITRWKASCAASAPKMLPAPRSSEFDCLGRQPQCERRASSRLTLRRHRALLRFNVRTDQAEPQAEAAGRAAPITAIQTVEDARQILRRDALAR